MKKKKPAAQQYTTFSHHQHFPITKLRSKLILNNLIPNFTSISFEWTTTFGRLTTEN